MMDTGRLYGDSLYDLAAEEKLTETLMGQVEMVAEVLKENPEYLTLLSEPSVAKAERLSLIDEAFGEQVHPYLLNFSRFCAVRASSAVFPDVVGNSDAVIMKTTTLPRHSLSQRLR